MAFWVVYLAFKTVIEPSNERWFELHVGATSEPGR